MVGGHSGYRRAAGGVDRRASRDRAHVARAAKLILCDALERAHFERGWVVETAYAAHLGRMADERAGRAVRVAGDVVALAYTPASVGVRRAPRLVLSREALRAMDAKPATGVALARQVGVLARPVAGVTLVVSRGAWLYSVALG